MAATGRINATAVNFRIGFLVISISATRMGSRGSSGTIDGRYPPVSSIKVEGEAISAYTSGGGLGDVQGRSGRHSCIGSIAALTENFQTCGYGQWL